MKRIRKCPRCQQGEIFRRPPYNYTKFHEMNKDCPECGQTFHPEPGFYFGAMYISYAFGVALFSFTGLILYFFNALSLTTGIIMVVGLTLITYPFMFQYSRLLFLHLFGGIR